METKKGKSGAFCSGSYNSNFGSQSVDQSGVTDLALQDLIYAMYLEFAVCNLRESKCVRDASVYINIHGKLVTETELVDDSKRQDGRKSVRMVTKFVEGVSEGVLKVCWGGYLRFICMCDIVLISKL